MSEPASVGHELDAEPHDNANVNVSDCQEYQIPDIPDIIQHQSTVDRSRVTVFDDTQEEICEFIEKFLDNPDIERVYDWGTEAEPRFAEEFLMAEWNHGHLVNSSRKVQRLVDRCHKLFADRPEVRQNIRAISGCYKSGPHGTHWHHHLLFRMLMNVMQISYMPHYLWFRDSYYAMERVSSDEVWDINANQRPFRLFNCLMHRGRNHRFVALQVLIQSGLIMSGWDNTFEMSSNTHYPSITSFGNSDDAWKNICEAVKTDFVPDRFKNIMPYARHFFPDATFSAGILREQASHQYAQCLFDIVVETTTNTDFFTEKTFKPLFYGKPFVILGSIGQNTSLKEWGFETFDEYFNLKDDADPYLRYIHHDWTHESDWEKFYDHYEKILQPMISLNSYLSDTVSNRTEQEAELMKIKGELSEKCRYNQARLMEVMFDDDIIPAECWDLRTPTATNPRYIGRVRQLYRSHPYFSKLVNTPKTFAEEYAEHYYENRHRSKT